ncbi:hypothetical protein Hanom_Chr01g00069281 [Helianthus anomalus]
MAKQEVATIANNTSIATPKNLISYKKLLIIKRVLHFWAFVTWAHYT